MNYTRVYTDSQGKTHFEEVEVEFELVEFAPPAPPLFVSSFNSAARYAFCAFPPGWVGDWHPAPRRQFFYILTGEMEIEVSDGETRRFGPGHVVFLDDVTGDGHVARITGSDELQCAVMQLPD